MVTFEDLAELVSTLNELYGSEDYIPAELVFVEGTFFIKFNGQFIWDDDNHGRDDILEVDRFVRARINIMYKPVRKAVASHILQVMVPKIKQAGFETSEQYEDLIDELKEVLEDL